MEISSTSCCPLFILTAPALRNSPSLGFKMFPLHFKLLKVFCPSLVGSPKIGASSCLLADKRAQVPHQVVGLSPSGAGGGPCPYCGDGSHGTGYVFRGYPLGQSFFFRLKRISEALLDNSFGLYLLIPLTLFSGFLHTRYYNYLHSRQYK